MSKRLTDTDLWDKEWFMALPPRLKCAVKFIRDKCDLAGVWSPNWMLANIYINDPAMPIKEEEVLNIDGGKQFQKLPSGKIFCVDFVLFQNGVIKPDATSPIHVKILELLTSHGIDYNTLYIGYKGGIQYPGSNSSSNSKGNSKSSSKGKEEPKTELVYPFDSEQFKQVWGVLITQPKWKRKTIEALQASLWKLSTYQEEEAIKMVYNTIAGGWQGLFEIDNKKQNGRQQIANANNSTGAELAADALNFLSKRKAQGGS